MSKSTLENKRVKPKRPDQPRSFSSHAELLQDMRQFQQEVTRTPEAALAFLKRAGLVCHGPIISDTSIGAISLRGQDEHERQKTTQSV